MVRTQIQLPDEMYRRLKAYADERETTFVEAVRRSIDYMLSVHPNPAPARTKWKIPKVRSMGRVLLPESEWRAAANERPLEDIFPELRKHEK